MCFSRSVVGSHQRNTFSVSSLCQTKQAEYFTDCGKVWPLKTERVRSGRLRNLTRSSPGPYTLTLHPTP
jgi:hypothetical protein